MRENGYGVLVTAMRDRRSDLDNNPVPQPWADRPAFGTFKGLPWWMVVLLAVALTAFGTLIDAVTSKGLGITFQITYVLGCVAAIVLVQRRSLFGPMVQPPLVMMVVAPPILLLFAGGSGGLTGKLVTLGPSLVLNFPAMAVATVLALGIGIARLIIQSKPTTPRAQQRRPASSTAQRSKPAGGLGRPSPRTPSASRAEPTRSPGESRTGIPRDPRGSGLPPRQPTTRFPERSSDFDRPLPPRQNPAPHRSGAVRQPPLPPRRPRYPRDEP